MKLCTLYCWCLLLLCVCLHPSCAHHVTYCVYHVLSDVCHVTWCVCHVTPPSPLPPSPPSLPDGTMAASQEPMQRDFSQISPTSAFWFETARAAEQIIHFQFGKHHIAVTHPFSVTYQLGEVMWTYATLHLEVVVIPMCPKGAKCIYSIMFRSVLTLIYSSCHYSGM